MNYPDNTAGQENPEQDIRIGNEILKLKLMAERGARFGDNDKEIPAEIEEEFLKNVEAFEAAFDKAMPVTIYECIGQPTYKKVDELKEEEVQPETERLMTLLHAKNILLYVMGEYDLSIIYKFITEELFQEEIRPVDHPGYLHNYVYEEFHPNHHVSIGLTAQQFLSHWFEKGFDEKASEFATQIITANARTFSRSEMVDKLRKCLDSYQSFLNIRFKGPETSFEWNDEESRGLGHAEGIFSYDAVLENGEVIHIEDPFKLYMSNEDGCWRIFYFVFPGFVW
ncbi:MAG: hypothetical protein ACHQFX_20910 [Chitinophagales bacterium]